VVNEASVATRRNELVVSQDSGRRTAWLTAGAGAAAIASFYGTTALLVGVLPVCGIKLTICTPCVKAQGYEQSHLIDGIEITGSSKVNEPIKASAATLSF
jgi:hypothetical protein